MYVRDSCMTHMKKISEKIRSNSLTSFHRFQVAEQNHTEHCKPHQEYKYDKDNDDETNAISSDTGDKLLHHWMQSQGT